MRVPGFGGFRAGETAARGGDFADKQLYNPVAPIALSHASRFRTGRSLLAPYAGGSLLDYGCGDGSYLLLNEDLVGRGVGVDVSVSGIADCRRRFADHPRLAFHTVAELDSSHDGNYDVVTCMEVLEHCSDADVDVVLSDLRRLVKPRGAIIISVPIEVGPVLLVKQAMRRLAASMRVRSYGHPNERYRPAELARMVFAGAGVSIPRPAYREMVDGREVVTGYGHKGFNWRTLREHVARELDVTRVTFSPLPSFGGLISSQAWFICRRPD